MTAPVDLDRPAEGHTAEVGRVWLGNIYGVGRVYGTTLSCSCGRLAGLVAERAPWTVRGRAAAEAAYRAHLVAEGLAP